MKCLQIFTMMMLLACLAGCRRSDDPQAARRLEQAALLLSVAPEKAVSLLDSITDPEHLNARQNAHWCLLRCQLADTLREALPYSFQLERAVRYYRREGSPLEQARALLYLGRSYVAERNYIGAQDAYMDALWLAYDEGDWNLTGHICSYIGDVYQFKAAYPLAKEKYVEAAGYFLQAGNQRGRAYALRDAGRQAAFEDSLGLALSYLSEADTLLRALGDSAGLISVLNGLGNVYLQQGRYSLAESCFKQAIIGGDNDDDVPTYSALSSLYLEQGRLDSARHYCRLAEAPTSNPYTHLELSYTYYQIAKAEHRTAEALSYLEQYFEQGDSLLHARNHADILGIEKHYNHNKLMAENAELRKSRRHYAYLSAALLFAVALCVILYQVRLNWRNRKIILQQEELQEKAEQLQLLVSELDDNREAMKQLAARLEAHNDTPAGDLQNQYAEHQKAAEQLTRQISRGRHELFLESAIRRKLLRLSDKVVPGSRRPLLADRDWRAVCTLVNATYPHIAPLLREADLTEKERLYAYLSVFDFEASREAILLNIQVDSVSKYRQRVRKKLDIIGKSVSLRDYLVGSCLNG